MKKITKFLSGEFLIAMALVVPVGWDVSKVDFPVGPLNCYAQENGAAESGGTDVQWFKEQMGIAPKYAEESEGVYGISWAHFVAMVLMVGFVAATFVVVYLRNKRTRRIISQLLKEED